MHSYALRMRISVSFCTKRCIIMRAENRVFSPRSRRDPFCANRSVKMRAKSAQIGPVSNALPAPTDLLRYNVDTFPKRLIFSFELKANMRTKH